MCGRYSLTTPEEAVRRLFAYEGPPRNLAPRYNIAPTQEAPVVRAGRDGGRELALLRWGLIPAWARDPAIGSRLINARIESAARKPSFRDALRRRRCLVVADGFYEWGGEGPNRRPYRVRRRDGLPFAFAGLWERWQGPVEGKPAVLETFTILTTRANALVAPIHDRMPVIVDPAAYEAWLDAETTPPAAVLPLLVSVPAEPFEIYPVSARVNNPRNDDAGCIAPVEEPQTSA